MYSGAGVERYWSVVRGVLCAMAEGCCGPAGRGGQPGRRTTGLSWEGAGAETRTKLRSSDGKWHFQSGHRRDGCGECTVVLYQRQRQGVSTSVDWRAMVVKYIFAFAAAL